MKFKTLGEADYAFCDDCKAEWVGVEREWELYERNIKEYVYTKALGGWARIEKAQGF
jgi:hypothetical protein